MSNKDNTTNFKLASRGYSEDNHQRIIGILDNLYGEYHSNGEKALISYMIPETCDKVEMNVIAAVESAGISQDILTLHCTILPYDNGTVITIHTI